MRPAKARWLAVLQRAEDRPQTRVTMQKWHRRRISPSSAEVIVQWSAETTQSLRLTPEETKKYSDLTMAPGVAFEKKTRQTPEQVMQSRTRQPSGKAPTLMSQYRNQHNLPGHLLKSKGLMGTFIEGPRCTKMVDTHRRAHDARRHGHHLRRQPDRYRLEALRQRNHAA